MINACSTGQGGGVGGKQAKEISATGPTVLNVHSTPSTIELNKNLEPNAPAEVFADVKDFTSKITDVKLRFTHIPLEIPMEHVAGTTWKVQLSNDQLKKLAVAGQTITYDFEVIAANENGEISSNREPVQVAIKTPEPSEITTGAG